MTKEPTIDQLKAEIDSLRIQRDDAMEEAKHWVNMYGIITTELRQAYKLRCLPIQSIRFSIDKYRSLRCERIDLKKTIRALSKTIGQTNSGVQAMTVKKEEKSYNRA